MRLVVFAGLVGAAAALAGLERCTTDSDCRANDAGQAACQQDPNDPSSGYCVSGTRCTVDNAITTALSVKGACLVVECLQGHVATGDRRACVPVPTDGSTSALEGAARCWIKNSVATVPGVEDCLVLACARGYLPTLDRKACVFDTSAPTPVPTPLPTAAPDTRCLIENALATVPGVQECLVLACKPGYLPTLDRKACVSGTDDSAPEDPADGPDGATDGAAHDDDLTDAEKAAVGLGVAFGVIGAAGIAFLCLCGKRDAAAAEAADNKEMEPAAANV